MNYEDELIKIIRNDLFLMTILKTVELLDLPDCWICAGVLRNKLWDVLHGIHTSANDIDVIYFQENDVTIETEKRFEAQLHRLLPDLPWSVKNQARMHLKNHLQPFSSSFDGISHFPETATAIGARLINNHIEIIAPYGLTDLFELKIEPTPKYLKTEKLHPIYQQRVATKKWKTIWTNLILNN
ncbi:MAG: nucleotidyltransferase family protein [Solibacillus sp.]